MLWKGAGMMENQDETTRDVDDLIFREEVWHVSER